MSGSNRDLSAYTHSKSPAGKGNENMDEYYQVIRALPAWLARPLGMLPSELAVRIHELRFRTGHGISLTIQGRQCPLKELPECPSALREIRLNTMQMEEIFYTLCGGSVHTHQNELAQGFLTTAQGCRVGVAGKFSEQNGECVLQQILSLNFRVSRIIDDPLPEELCTLLAGHFVGLLIAGEPDSGKTTLLRQIARELEKLRRSVTVIDERSELFSSLNRPEFPAIDVLQGVPKEQAVQMALRTLSPQVILLDELGSLAETSALEQGFFGGVDFVASVHASGKEDALRRPQVRYLQQHEMMRVLVVLQGRNAPGQISEVCTF